VARTHSRSYLVVFFCVSCVKPLGILLESWFISQITSRGSPALCGPQFDNYWESVWSNKSSCWRVSRGSGRIIVLWIARRAYKRVGSELSISVACCNIIQGPGIGHMNRFNTLASMKYILAVCMAWYKTELKKLISVTLVRERTRPTERQPLVCEVVPTFADRGCCVVSVTDSHGR
jgi:hypothetical protein